MEHPERTHEGENEISGKDIVTIIRDQAAQNIALQLNALGYLNQV